MPAAIAAFLREHPKVESGHLSRLPRGGIAGQGRLRPPVRRGGLDLLLPDPRRRGGGLRHARPPEGVPHGGQPRRHREPDLPFRHDHALSRVRRTSAARSASTTPPCASRSASSTPTISSPTSPRPWTHSDMTDVTLPPPDRFSIAGKVHAIRPSMSRPARRRRRRGRLRRGDRGRQGGRLRHAGRREPGLGRPRRHGRAVLFRRPRDQGGADAGAAGGAGPRDEPGAGRGAGGRRRRQAVDQRLGRLGQGAGPQRPRVPGLAGLADEDEELAGRLRPADASPPARATSTSPSPAPTSRA